MNPKNQNGLIGIVAKCITQKPLVCMYVYVYMCICVCICVFVHLYIDQ